jgi:hypothetical protein
VREADNLPPYSADVKKSRSLNSPRPLWACMACNRCALPVFNLLYGSAHVRKKEKLKTRHEIMSECDRFEACYSLFSLRDIKAR